MDFNTCPICKKDRALVARECMEGYQVSLGKYTACKACGPAVLSKKDSRRAGQAITGGSPNSIFDGIHRRGAEAIRKVKMTEATLAALEDKLARAEKDSGAGYLASLPIFERVLAVFFPGIVSRRRRS
jgi:hypothetical protein